MKKQIVLSSTIEETRKELTEDDLFDLFKKKVELLHPGEKFLFQRSNEHLTAKTDGVDIPLDLNQPGTNLDQNLNEFLHKNFDRTKVPGGVRKQSYNCLMCFATSEKTIKDLFETPNPFKTSERPLPLKSFGIKSFDWTKKEFVRLGFDVGKYPFFQ